MQISDISKMKRISSDIVVKTKRLILQPVFSEFKCEICNAFTPEVTRYMPFVPDGDIKVTEAFIGQSEQELMKGKSVQFCIIKKLTKECVGCCGLQHTDTKAIEMGLWLKKDAQGNGYGTETVKALIDVAEKNREIDYLVYPVDKDNWASRKIPEKLGFVAAGSYEKKKTETEMLHVIEYRKYNPASGKGL